MARASSTTASAGSPRALTLVLAQRLWQGGGGLVTSLLIVSFLTPEQQGWYYGLLSLAAVYTLFDLGLSIVLVQVSAHSSLDLRWAPGGQLEGSGADRFAALAARAFRQYLFLAIGFALFVLPAGWVLFGQSEIPMPGWELQWTAIGLATALSLLPIPFLALIEGSGQVASVYLIRLVQSMAGTLATWSALLLGWGLWAALMLPLSVVVVQSGWLALRHGSLLAAAVRGSPVGLAWSTEIWPLQWRVGLTWFAGYLLTQIQTLVLFRTQGAAVAGQFGLSLTLGNMVGLLALSWITRHVPLMARTAAVRDWPMLRRVFNADLVRSCAVFLLGAGGLCILLLLFPEHLMAGRVLPFWTFAGLIAALFLTHVGSALAAHLRSFRREPLVWISVCGAVLTLVLAAMAAQVTGAAGVVLVLLLVQGILVLPASVIIWRRRIAEWTAQ